MNIVEPIRDPKKIDAMKSYLKAKNIRDYVMFVVGINIALRISDLLRLTWRDVLREDGREFKIVKIREGKTFKARWIRLNRTAQEAFEDYLKILGSFSMEDYIFKSREGENRHITRQQALNILKEAATETGVRDNVGTHTLRKTWGYNAWKSGFNPALIMETLNHSNLGITRRYLGIRQDEINELYENLNI